MVRPMTMALVLLVLVLPSVSWGQQGEEYVTWVRYYRTNPGQEGEFVGLVKEISEDTLDGMLEDGSLVSWGIMVPFTRTADNWTHALWLSAKDWAHVDDVVARFVAADKARGEPANAAVMERFRKVVDVESVYDEVLRHVVVPVAERPAAGGDMPAYFRVSFYKIKWPHEKDAVDLYRRVALPVYEDLIADGTVIDSGFSVREMPCDSDWTHVSWTLVSNLAALDEMRAAFKEAESARSEQEQAEIAAEIAKCLDVESYRSQILRIVYLGGQGDK